MEQNAADLLGSSECTANKNRYLKLGNANGNPEEA